jgi:hypothetical protein
MPTSPTAPTSSITNSQKADQIVTRTPHQTEKDVRALISLASAGLVPMFDEQKQLFCAKFIRTDCGMVREAISHRYTLITLMGLHRLEQSGKHPPIAVQPTFDALLRNSFPPNSVSHGTTPRHHGSTGDVATSPQDSWLRGAGDLGLLLWLCALVAPDRLDDFLANHDIAAALEQFSDARESRTMELSWVLSGLAHAAFARPELRERLARLAARVSATLQGNRGSAGAFGHQASPGTGGRTARGISKGIAGSLRGRLGSFADQVYPIYAFAWVARAFGFSGALDIANSCAANICRAQGALGQWWWHYDAKSGQAVGKYPVYAVHQHAMAPLALFALADAGGRDFSRELYLGLEWIYGANELQVDMRDTAANVVWRCIRPAASRRYMDQALAMLKLAGKSKTPRELHVLQECWPYELGWLIYAFAGRKID